jgi:hypothetical protein
MSSDGGGCYIRPEMFLGLRIPALIWMIVFVSSVARAQDSFPGIAGMVLGPIGQAVAEGLRGGSVARSPDEGDECSRLITAFPEHLQVREKTCRYGPQPPRYHSCADFTEHIHAMAKNVLACPHVPPSIRRAAIEARNRFAGPAGANRRAAARRIHFYDCANAVASQCLGRCVGNLACAAQCREANTHVCNQ